MQTAADNHKHAIVQITAYTLAISAQTKYAQLITRTLYELNLKKYWKT